MTPQRFDPATQGELDSSSMTRQEGTAIFKGNAQRRSAWERRQAIVSHPAFRMGQGDPSHDPISGELHRGSLRPVEHGRDFLHDLATGAKEVAGGTIDTYRDMTVELVRGVGQIANQVGDRLSGHIRPFHAGQHDSLNDPIWGELHRGSLRPAVHGPDIPHQIAEGVLAGATQAIEGAKDFVKEVGDWFGDRGEDIGREFLSYSVVRNVPEMAGVGTVSNYRNRALPYSDNVEAPIFPKDSPAFKEMQDRLAGRWTPVIPGNTLDYEEMTADQYALIPAVQQANDNVRRLTDSAYAYAPAVAQASQESRGLTDKAAELSYTMGGVNEIIAAAPAHLADVNASFAVTSGERLPEMIGQMGTLEDQTLAAVSAFSQLAAAPRGSPPTGGTSGGGSSARPYSAELQAFLDTPAPPNLKEIYLDQFKQGHDMSGFQNAEHWWEKHLEHVAQLKAAGHAFAQGTSFAPGGMALVGEMGPELVNLPRGSQVIPNPQLGSAVTVNVTVEGSVVAERDLAQRIRQELIRTSRRTVDLGFVT